MSKPTAKTKKAANLIGKAITLADLTKYQAGAIVSREVLRKPTGTVTAFAFDAGQALSEHTAPFDALICVLDGEAEMIIFPAHKPHAVNAVTRFKMLLVMIRS